MSENITFRSHLLGSLTDFSEGSGLGVLSKPSVLVDLVILLSRYTEEGIQLHPEVFLFENVDDALKVIPESTKIQLGKSKFDSTTIHLAIKKCAPLAIGGWHIYMEHQNGELSYGVFHGSPSPLSMTAVDTLFLGSGSNDKAVHMRQVAENCVELRNTSGLRHVIFLSHKHDSEPSPTQNLVQLVDAICRDVPTDVLDQCKTYFLKAISIALRLCHGTLIAVCNSNSQPRFLRDGVVLDSPVDLPNIIRDIEKGFISEIELISIGSLIRGMLTSDGIVLFDTHGRLRSYNCFVAPMKAKGSAVSGGARRRAYDALCARQGSGLTAILMQSQDGSTYFRSDGDAKTA